MAFPPPPPQKKNLRRKHSQQWMEKNHSIMCKTDMTFFKILKLGIKNCPWEGSKEELGRQEGGEIFIGMQKQK